MTMSGMEILEFQRAIKTERKQRGMTQEQLAAKLYISRSYLCHIERIDCMIGEELAERIAAYFDQTDSAKYIQGIRDTLDKAVEEVQALRTYEAVLSIRHARRLFDDYMRMTS